MDLGLAERAYLVTGASAGLGLATARALVGDGARVTISSRDAGRVSAAAEGLGPAALGVVADNADPDAAAHAVQAAVQHGGGRLDGLLVSVGGPSPARTLDVAEQTWSVQFDTLFLGALRYVRAALPHLAAGAAIGFVLSTSVRGPLPGLAVSNALRPALAMTAKTLADELGPRAIRVFGLVPGVIATDRVRQLQSSRPGHDPTADIPLNRAGQPEEFGRVAAFVLSPAASYISGCLVTVDGGLARSL